MHIYNIYIYMVMAFKPFFANPQDLKGRRILEKILCKLAKVQSDIMFLKKCKEYCLIPKGFRLNDPVQYFPNIIQMDVASSRPDYLADIVDSLNFQTFSTRQTPHIDD